MELEINNSDPISLRHVSCVDETIANTSSSNNNLVELKKYLCIVCGLVYDEAEGWPDDGIAPGTRWDDVPLNWACPDCGAIKDDFDMVEIT